MEVSVLELMKSERMAANLIAGEEAAEAIADVLNVARLQRKRERRNVFRILGVTAVIVIFLLFIDSNSGISLMDRQYLRAWHSAKPA